MIKWLELMGSLEAHRRYFYFSNILYERGLYVSSKVTSPTYFVHTKRALPRAMGKLSSQEEALSDDRRRSWFKLKGSHTTWLHAYRHPRQDIVRQGEVSWQPMTPIAAWQSEDIFARMWRVSVNEIVASVAARLLRRCLSWVNASPTNNHRVQ
jgi:hypothetical protein